MEVRILAIGITELQRTILLSVTDPKTVQSIQVDLDFISEIAPENYPHIVLCGPTSGEITLEELAQFLRMQFQDRILYYATEIREGFDRKAYLKNGFDEAFLLPLETELFKEKVATLIAQVTKQEIKHYKNVRIADLQAGEDLTFDTYLFFPRNQKYVKYSKSGASMSEESVKKLKEKQVGSMFVRLDQMQEFYKFSANQIKKLQTSDSMSQTEKQEKLEQSVRSLVIDIFSESSATGSFDAGKERIKDCQEIVKSYIQSCSTEKGAWFDKILQTTGGQSSGYSHAANTSTYAALFSLGMGIGVPEDVALAALLHDIGLADLPQEVQAGKESEMTPENLKIYQTHVEKSVQIIRSRKMASQESIIKMIEQHHERYDGKGFPKGISDRRFLPEAQVLALADLFDEVTSYKDNQERVQPEQFVEYINNSSHAGRFSIEILAKLSRLFPKAQAA